MDPKHDLAQSRWSSRTSRLIDVICLLMLLVVVATVIYGLALRAYWAHGYYIAVVIAVIGAVVMMVGLAQQAIAARDAATWRDMALWQLRAARQKVAAGQPPASPYGNAMPDADSSDYYEHLISAFLENVEYAGEEVAKR